MPTTPILSADLRTALLATMARLGVRSESTGYFFDWYNDDALPPWVPPDCADAWRAAYWCWPCMDALVTHCKELRRIWEYWNGALLDIMGEPVGATYGIGTNDAPGHGPYWCDTCQAYLECGFWLSNVEDLVESAALECPLGRGTLPEIVEALDYYGQALPFCCDAPCWFAPFNSRWVPPVVTIDMARWHVTARVPVPVPCCACLQWVTMEARKAQKVITRVRLWQDLCRLAARAIDQFAESVSIWVLYL